MAILQALWIGPDGHSRRARRGSVEGWQEGKVEGWQEGQVGTRPLPRPDEPLLAAIERADAAAILSYLDSAPLPAAREHARELASLHGAVSRWIAFALADETAASERVLALGGSPLVAPTHAAAMRARRAPLAERCLRAAADEGAVDAEELLRRLELSELAEFALDRREPPDGARSIAKRLSRTASGRRRARSTRALGCPVLCACPRNRRRRRLGRDRARALAARRGGRRARRASWASSKRGGIP